MSPRVMKAINSALLVLAFGGGVMIFTGAPVNGGILLAGSIGGIVMVYRIGQGPQD